MTDSNVVPIIAAPHEESAPNVILMGEVSSGKTRSIRTLIEAGVEVFMIPTEPNYADVLGDIPSDRLHWRYIPSYSDTLAQLKQTSELLRVSDMEAIKKMPGQNRAQYNQWFDLLGACNNFVDDRTGKSYGDVGLLTNKQALVIDGLSGINNMATRLVAGNKPFMSWPEFEAAQFCVEQFVNTLAQSLKCWFVLTTHVERENDPISGLQKIMPSTIGRVLAPRLPKNFSEVLYCRRIVAGSQQTWVWDNMTTEANVKFRNLAPSPSIKPDFGLIKSNWEKKVQFIQPT